MATCPSQEALILRKGKATNREQRMERRHLSEITNKHRREERQEDEEGVVLGTIFITGGGTEKVTDLKLPRQCPLVLLVKTGGTQGTLLETE
jgi:hypothetical protein